MASRKQSLLGAPSVLVFLLSTASLFLLAVVLLPLASGADPQAATLAPFTITGHRPVTHEVGVPLSAVITATFDEDVNGTTVTSGTFVVHGNLGGTATGTFDYDGASRTLTLDPDRTFHAGEVLRVSATSAISSAGDTSLAPYGWQFSAGDVYVHCVGGFISVEAGLTGVADSSVAWADYDKDGDLDILLTGQDEHADWVSKVYRNNGEGATPAFTDISAGLAGLRHSAVAWGDLDNDGDLDIVLTGQDKYGHGVSKVYRNDWDTPAPAFTDMYAGLTGVYHGSVAMGDCDNDGDLDILLTGWSPLGYASKVYRNDGDGSFTDIGAGLTGVGYSSVAWGDYDNDGDLDVLLAGWSGSASVSKVYRNSGAGAFSDIGAALTGVLYSSVAWGDYDNDGDLDILLTGSGVSKVYRNNGAGNFTDVGAGLSGVSAGSAVWGDHDNDGDLDILLTGTHVSQVYRNDGAGVFTDIGAGLTGVCYSSVAWGDYDKDGDLDILLTGQDSTGAPVSEVYRNDDCRRIISHSPQAHAVGVATTAAITATFDQELDASTVTCDSFAVQGHLGGLLTGTYAYDGPSRTLTLDPDRAFHAGEVLRVSASSAIRGTEGQRLSPYGWQFTAGDVFSRCVARFTDVDAGLTSLYGSSGAWGDYDNDGDLDILLTGMDSSYARRSMVYRNDGGGAFSDIAAGLTAVSSGSAAWGDYNNDGDLDMVLTGYDGATMLSKVYRNDGGGSFTEIGAGLIGLYDGSAAWGDYDNDGDLDILLTGMDSSYTGRSKVYRNDGGGDFTDIGAGLTGVGYGCAAWGDYDNDGDLDIVLTGEALVPPSFVPVSKVYRNDGEGTFTDIAAGLIGVYERTAAAWGDYDTDGDLDILLTGQSSGGSSVSRVYRNDGGAAFTDISAGLTGVYGGSVAWGDYDNDGDLDILLTGYTGSARVSKVYRNDGGAFTDIDAGLTGVHRGSVAWGDCDNDGDLDILLTGEESNNVEQSKVYRNDDCPKLDTVKAVHTSTAQPGDVITYTIVIANNGDIDGTGAVVSDTLPAGLSFAGPVALDPPGAGTAGAPPILLSSATITAGAAITLTFPVTVNTGLAVGAVVTNTAAVSCSEVATPVEASVAIAIANVAPTLGAVDPASGSGPPGVTAYFTATWQDANGWEDLKHCYFHIGDSPTIAGNVTLLYNAVKDKLWLRSDDGSMWLGGYAPGTANLLENSQAKVHCAATSAEGDGDTLVVKWLIEFKAGYAGTKKLGLKGKDRQGAKAKGAWKGTWTITP